MANNGKDPQGWSRSIFPDNSPGRPSPPDRDRNQPPAFRALIYHVRMPLDLVWPRTTDLDLLGARDRVQFVITAYQAGLFDS
jgi:hypothetical protein